MNHLKPEELTEFLYGETSPEEHPEITRHLQECPQCSALLASWRATRAELQAWKLPPLGRSRSGWTRTGADTGAIWKWAAAALVMAGIGFGLARLTLPASDPSRLRAELSAQITAQITEQLKAQLARVAADQSARQLEYQQAVIKAVGRLEARRSLELASLRHDVETVAVTAQDELDTTRQGLYELAASKSRNP